MTNEIICRLSKTTNVLIKGNDPAVDLNKPLIAINWFSTKIEWLYHFYNILAFKSVRKIGGSALFKGKITSTILEDNHGGREILLIVKYPNGPSFKSLLESTYFKLVSIIRIIAVKRFTFGFTHPQDIDDSSKACDGFSYLVHHFKLNNSSEDPFAKLTLLLGDNIKVKYAGKMVAQLFSQQKSEPMQPVYNIMDGIILYESESEDELFHMINTPEYQNVLKTIKSSYIGFLKRIL